ncbi:MAG TPA: glycosyltransferase family A protein [Thermoanaerobaculia bacterium]
MRPRVTVLIPTYNWSSVLPYSIGSVLRQTFTDFELLVVGDGCTDDSEQVVEGMNDARVRWINLPENTRHQSGPNNEGLRQAQGELIAYLGHDDLWFPHHLEVLVRAIEGHDLAYSLGMQVVGDYLWPNVHRPAVGHFGSPLSMMHRKAVTDTLGGWGQYRGRVGPDVELWQRAQKAGCSFAFAPRLTGVKFPAAFRKNVYIERPHHEQKAWLARIDDEPELETTMLVQFAVGDAVPNAVPYRELMRQVVRQTLARFRMRAKLNAPKFHNVDEVRRYKGLQGRD